MSSGPGISSRIVSSANSNNATIAKVGGGNLYGFDLVNAVASVRYLKFYDKATAPAPATDVPVLVFTLQASVPRTVLGLNFRFINGISFILVTGNADTDNTAVGAADILGLNVLCS